MSADNRPMASSQPEALVLGAGGALGSALLERAIGCGRYGRVGALVTRPMDASLSGFVALPFAGLAAPPPLREPATAWIVFDRERAANGREAAFFRPQPDQLIGLARWLFDGGVRRLLVVMPHAPGLLPQALRGGLASLDEQAVAALGFRQLLLLRSAQAAPADAAAAWPQRVARWVLSQLRWMIATAELPVRNDRVAAFAVQLALALDAAPAGARVVPPELLWQSAQIDEAALPALARDWLAGASR